MESKKFVTVTLWKDAEGNWMDTEKADAEAVEFRVNKPNRAIDQESLIEYNKELRKLLEGGSEFLLRAEVQDIVKKRGLWNDDKEVEHKRLKRKVSEAVTELTRGQIRKDDAYDKCVEIIKLRQEVMQLDNQRNMLDGQTAESKAEETKFNYWIYRCSTYNKDGKLVFGNLSFNQFLESEDPLVNFMGVKLLELMTASGNTNKQPEWKFLEKYGYTDEKGRLLDKTKSYLVNLEGKRINDKGEFVNDEGVVVDEFGNEVVDIENVDFLD